MGQEEVLAVRGKPAAIKPFGSEWRSEFLIDPAWRNLNHGKLVSCEVL
jgi:hypothetical protein